LPSSYSARLRLFGTRPAAQALCRSEQYNGLVVDGTKACSSEQLGLIELCVREQITVRRADGAPSVAIDGHTAVENARNASQGGAGRQAANKELDPTGR